MEPLNRTATELVDEAIDFADELRIAVHHLDNEAVVLDFGIDAAGGLEPGLLFAELRTGGLATVTTRLETLDGAPHPFVELSTDHPRLALLESQRAGWRLPDNGGWGSGPAQRLRDGTPVGPEETFDFAVLAIESPSLPDESLAEAIAGELDVPTAGTLLPTVPAASPAGATALAAGSAEVTVHRLEQLGYDPAHVRVATGAAPLPPITADEETARAQANDALAYGARVYLLVDEPVDRAADLPFEATEHAGESFASLLATAEGDLAALGDAYAPAAVTIDVVGGETASYGETDEARLAASWGR